MRDLDVAFAHADHQRAVLHPMAHGPSIDSVHSKNALSGESIHGFPLATKHET